MDPPLPGTLAVTQVGMLLGKGWLLAGTCPLEPDIRIISEDWLPVSRCVDSLRFGSPSKLADVTGERAGKRY